MAETRRKKKKQKKERSGLIWLLVILVFMVGVMSWQTVRLRDKAEEYVRKEQELASAIASESDRAAELAEMGKLRQTLYYIEKMAREKLGLVYPDDVILEPEQKPGS